MTCKGCGGPLTAPKTGRPPRFCSIGCRRSLEVAIRRETRRLERLDEERDRFEMLLDEFRVHPPFGTRVVAQTQLNLATVRRQVGEAQDRLRDLLDDPDPGETE